MASILFVHNNFPGQFGFLAQALVERGHEVAAIASTTGRSVEGVEILQWRNSRGSTPGVPREVLRIEADLIRGQAAAQSATALRERGFLPDLIIGHPGWGETTYLRELFPRARQIIYAEYYYRSEGGDIGFDPEFSPPQGEPHKVYAKNAGMALAFAEADAIVAPTPFQQSLLPPAFRDRTRVIHEGVDTDRIRRRVGQTLTLTSGKVIDGSRPLITFINRRLEPLRGYHVFMRALPRALAEVPDADVLIIGADQRGGYGIPAPEGTTWGKQFLTEVAGQLDMSRVHFTGPVEHELMLTALSLSSAHVYLTYPFVLSWSMLEAMACEALVIGSDTAPVRDAVIDGENGRLVPFFDVDGLSGALIAACRERDRFGDMRRAARATVESRFDRDRVCLPQWLGLISEVLEAGV